MIRAFKNLRQKWLNYGKYTKYLTYALGEILLVVLGILIALQINKWNEKVRNEQAFEFNIRQLYQQFTIEKFMDESVAGTYIFQIQLIDSILNHPDKFQNPSLPQVFQFLEIEMLEERDRQVNRDFTKTFLTFDKDNEFQNTLSTLLYKHINDEQFLLPSNQNLQPTIKINLSQYLDEFNIPRTNYYSGLMFDDYLTNARNERKFIIKNQYNFEITDFNVAMPDGFYQLLDQNDFKNELLNLREHKFRIISGLYILSTSCDKVLEIMQAEYPDLSIKFQNLSLIGSGSPAGDWNTDFPMKMKDDDGLVWEIEIQLQDGKIKFRNDPFWIFNWGQSNEGSEKLQFYGYDITVKRGTYRIILDINKDMLDMKLIEN